jgi:hypothetical protein
MAVSTYAAGFGSVSHATMRPEDLIPTFMEVLDEHREAMIMHYSTTLAHPAQVEDCKNNVGRIDDFLGAVEKRLEDPEYYANECSVYDLEELFDWLGLFAPAYGYFGSHPGDGADFGFWLSEDIECDFDGLRVDETSEVPDDYSGEVLHVNDHGNCTLYVADCGELTEVWAIV